MVGRRLRFSIKSLYLIKKERSVDLRAPLSLRDLATVTILLVQEGAFETIE